MSNLDRSTATMQTRLFEFDPASVNPDPIRITALVGTCLKIEKKYILLACVS